MHSCFVCYIMDSRLCPHQKNTWLRMIYCLQIIWWENRKFEWRSWSATILHREDMVQAGCDKLKPVLTSCCTWQVNCVVWLVMSLQIQNCNNADVLLDSGLNLFNIMANLCSEVRKLYCVSMEVDFWFGLQQGRLCNSDLSGLKLPVILPTHALNYSVQKWEKCIKYLRSRLFMFRTWIIRQLECVNSLTLLQVFALYLWIMHGVMFWI